MHVVSCTSYQLKLPLQWKAHNIFHASLLTPYKEMALNGNKYQEPAPDLINGQLEWEVEQILQVRQHCNQVQYLIQWKGFSEVHDSWEPAKNINADQLLQEFYKAHPTVIRNPTAPSPITIRTIITPMSLLSCLNQPLTPLTLSDCLGSPPPQLSQTPPPLPPSLPQTPQLEPIDTRPSMPETEPLSADVDLAEYSRDYSTPDGFTIFNCSIPDHHCYGCKFLTPDNTLRYPHYIKFHLNPVHHKHHIYGTRDDINNTHTTYSWALQSQTFIGPSISGNHAVDPDILVRNEEQQVKVDLALRELNDKGVVADIDIYCHLVPQEESLCQWEVALRHEKEEWALCHQEVKDWLCHSHVMEHLHPYCYNITRGRTFSFFSFPLPFVFAETRTFRNILLYFVPHDGHSSPG